MLARENTPTFTALFVDEHHDQLGCPKDRCASWKKLAKWASTSEMPIFLLSASAPPRLEKRLLKTYQLREGTTTFIRSTTQRAEIGIHTIYLNPLTDDADLNNLVRSLQGRLKEEDRMLVFFASCGAADKFGNEHRCAVFHSNLPLSGNTKGYNLHIWDRGACKVMACTSAFGAGVDRPNVRFVVIMEPAYSLLTTIQMVGRAGRDGKEAHAFLATVERQGVSFQDQRDPNLLWELGQLIHADECKVYQAMLYMDGENMALDCRQLGQQVRCDVCEPKDEMHLFATKAVTQRGRQVPEPVQRGQSSTGGAGRSGERQEVGAKFAKEEEEVVTRSQTSESAWMSDDPVSELTLRALEVVEKVNAVREVTEVRVFKVGREDVRLTRWKDAFSAACNGCRRLDARMGLLAWRRRAPGSGEMCSDDEKYATGKNATA